MSYLEEALTKLCNDAPKVTSNKSFFPDLDDFKKNSFVYKSFRYELETVDMCFTKRNIAKAEKKLNRINEDPIESIPGYSSLSYNPRKSVLNRNEMNFCYDIIKKKINFESVPINQLQEFEQTFKALIEREQMEFCELAENDWIQNNYRKKTHMNEDVKKFVDNLWEIKLNKVREYPKFYVELPIISLTPNSDCHISMIFDKHLITIGISEKFQNPKCVSLLNNLENAKSVENNKSIINDRLKEKFNYNSEIQSDELAEKLAIENNANFVLSSNGFSCLAVNLATNSFFEPWDLPITVKEYSIGTEKRRVIFVDKPLTKKKMNIHDRNVVYFKKAAKFSCCKLEQELEYTKLLENCQNYIKTKKQAEEKFYSSDSDDNLIIDFKESDDNKHHSSDEKNCNSNEFKKSQKMTKPRTQLHKKVTYNLWSIQNDNKNRLVKSCINYQMPLTLLIRSNEGHEVEKNKNYKVDVKLEYQIEYGAEIVSLTDLIKQWVSIFIRPNTELFRIRVNPWNGEIINTETRSALQLNQEAQRHYKDVISNRSVRNVFHILSQLTELPVGQYYMTHNSIQGAFASLYKADVNGKFSLYLNYNANKEEVAQENCSWNKLDPYTIIPTFKYKKRVPLTFFPRGCNQKENNSAVFLASLPKGTTKKSQPGLKKKGKKKNKKKRKTRKKETNCLDNENKK